MTLSVRMRHSFPERTLDVAFQAPPGITVLFGRSGAGKTTIVNAVAGLLRPEEAHISIDGRVLCDTDSGMHLPPQRRRLGYIFQEPRLFPHMTVRRNLMYGHRLAPAGATRPDPDRIIGLLGISGLLDRRPGTLSGGERQRVAIGRALLSAPGLILADEPLSSLDEARKAEVMPYFEWLRDELSIPMLYVTHSALEVARLAMTVVAIDNGKVLRQGPAGEVLSDPAVTPLGARAAGAVLETRVVRTHPDGISELDAGGLRLFLPDVGQPDGARVRVQIAAHDVMLARSRPKDISALNILPCTITGIRLGDGPGALVQLRAGDNMLLARITRRSVEALGLAPGDSVFALLKAVSISKANVADVLSDPWR